jgi:Kef-type K+ transport system membrane component KefB
VIRRAAIFGPIFFLVILLLGGSKTSVAAALIQTVVLVIIFVPFSYFMDRFVWRSYQKRLTKTKSS